MPESTQVHPFLTTVRVRRARGETLKELVAADLIETGNRDVVEVLVHGQVVAAADVSDGGIRVVSQAIETADENTIRTLVDASLAAMSDAVMSGLTAPHGNAAAAGAAPATPKPRQRAAAARQVARSKSLPR